MNVHNIRLCNILFTFFVHRNNIHTIHMFLVIIPTQNAQTTATTAFATVII